MNLSLSNLRVRSLDLPQPIGSIADDDDDNDRASAFADDNDTAQIRRLRSLLSLFALYAAALFVVILFSDGPDIGCILTGIAGHVLYASGKTALAWREATWLEAARLRLRSRLCPRRA